MRTFIAASFLIVKKSGKQSNIPIYQWDKRQSVVYSYTRILHSNKKNELLYKKGMSLIDIYTEEDSKEYIILYDSIYMKLT